jgi:hypothetical protein
MNENLTSLPQLPLIPVTFSKTLLTVELHTHLLSLLAIIVYVYPKSRYL